MVPCRHQPQINGNILGGKVFVDQLPQYPRLIAAAVYAVAQPDFNLLIIVFRRSRWYHNR